MNRINEFLTDGLNGLNPSSKLFHIIFQTINNKVCDIFSEQKQVDVVEPRSEVIKSVEKELKQSGLLARLKRNKK